MSTSKLEGALSALLNRHSAENQSNTPDFLLARYLLGCLEIFNKTVVARGHWYGQWPKVSAVKEAPPFGAVP